MIEEGQLNKTLYIRKCFKIFNSHLKVNKLIEWLYTKEETLHFQKEKMNFILCNKEIKHLIAKIHSMFIQEGTSLETSLLALNKNNKLYKNKFRKKIDRDWMYLEYTLYTKNKKKKLWINFNKNNKKKLIKEEKNLKKNKKIYKKEKCLKLEEQLMNHYPLKKNTLLKVNKLTLICREIDLINIMKLLNLINKLDLFLWDRISKCQDKSKPINKI